MNDDLVTCQACGDEMLSEDACPTDRGAEYYCRRCYDAHFTHCFACENEISVDDAIPGPNGWGDYCRRCRRPTPDYDENRPRHT